MNIVKVLSTRVVDGFRNVKFLRMGKDDVQETEQIAPHGIDSNPVKDMVAIYAPTLQQGEPVIIGFINKKLIDLEPGETSVFSTDENGALSTFIHMLADGTMKIGGDADNAVRYGQTAASINELKDDVNQLKNLIASWTPVPNDGGAALKAVLATWSGSALVEDISGAKIDEIKTL